MNKKITLLILCLILGILLIGFVQINSSKELILWNKFDSAKDIEQSTVGPSFMPYDQEESPWKTKANPIFTQGKFGHALSINAGKYAKKQRVYNLTFYNIGKYLSSNQGTIEFWFKFLKKPIDFANNPYRLFDGDWGLGSSIQVQCKDINNQARIIFSLFKGNRKISVYSLSDNLEGYNADALMNQWIHIAAVWNRSGIAETKDTMRLYINGKYLATADKNYWADSFENAADICGGNDNNIAKSFYMDNLKIWNYAKTNFDDRFWEDGKYLSKKNRFLLYLGYFFIIFSILGFIVNFVTKVKKKKETPNEINLERDKFRYEISFDEATQEIILNNVFVLKKPQYDSENHRVFEYLYNHANEDIPISELLKHVKFYKDLHQITYALGFKGELKTKFFKVSASLIRFNNPIFLKNKLSLAK
ncbi:MAG: LamG-like jellyroll fold domain-containing protein [Candidatus Margulisiibacteriota bacterium]|jgi:hypothetical protein